MRRRFNLYKGKFIFNVSNKNWRKIFLFLDITVFYNFYFVFLDLQLLHYCKFLCLQPDSTRELSPAKFAARNESMTSEAEGTEPSAFCTPDFSARDDCVSICANKMLRAKSDQFPPRLRHCVLRRNCKNSWEYKIT